MLSLKNESGSASFLGVLMLGAFATVFMAKEFQITGNRTHQIMMSNLSNVGNATNESAIMRFRSLLKNSGAGAPAVKIASPSTFASAGGPGYSINQGRLVIETPDARVWSNPAVLNSTNIPSKLRTEIKLIGIEVDSATGQIGAISVSALTQVNQGKFTKSTENKTRFVLEEINPPPPPPPPPGTSVSTPGGPGTPSTGNPATGTTVASNSTPVGCPLNNSPGTSSATSTTGGNSASAGASGAIAGTSATSNQAGAGACSGGTTGNTTGVSSSAATGSAARVNTSTNIGNGAGVATGSASGSGSANSASSVSSK